MRGHVTLLDGGMGQELYRRSGRPASPLWSAEVLRDRPDLVTALHGEFIAAGAEAITVNAYIVTPERMARDADIEYFEPLQRAALDAAREARDAAARPVRIAGSLPPLVASYHADEVPGDDQCAASYARIAGLQAPGVDLFLCETMSCIREAVAATAAAAATGKPVWTAFTVNDTQGTRLRSGESLADGAVAARDAGAGAVLANCSVPEAVADALPALAAAGLPYGGYANGFVAAASLMPGGTVDGLAARHDLDPAAYADHVGAWIEASATIVGGCCEVGPAHIAEIARRLGKSTRPR